jgi:hypothetical protein
MTLVVVLAVLTACAGESTETTATTSPEPTLPSSTSSTTGSTTTTIAPAYDAADVPTLALYLAAIESGLEGTSLEGAAFAEPESLINTGVLFCSLLDEGFSPIDVLRAWVAALSAEGATPPEEDLLLGGVVLGAAVKLICPEYLDDLEL